MPDVNPHPFRTAGLPFMAGPGVATRLLLAALALSPVVAGLATLLAGFEALPISFALCGYGLGVGLSFGLMQRGYPHAALGLCNVATLSRLALAASLLAPLAVGGGASWAVVAVAGLALSLDGADGWLARREGRVSDFGARFDMEVDSALALILALNAWASGTVAAIVLLLGLPRYVFAAAGRVLPWLDQPLPARFSRKVVCVLQLATLIALQLPLVAASVANPAVVVVAIALVWSFTVDILWLWRARA